MRFVGLVVAMVILIGVRGVGAVDIQFALDTQDVSGAPSDTPIDPVAGYGIVTIPGVSAADIVWPIPTGSPDVTSCGTGQPLWTHIANPNGTTIAALGLIIRSDLLFFHSTSPLLLECTPVASKHQLNTLVDQTIVIAVPDNPTIIALNVHFGWYYARCGDAPTNQNCIDWKAQLNTLVSRYPGRPQGITAATQAAVLILDANTFLSQQCKDQPGGPFC